MFGWFSDASVGFALESREPLGVVCEGVGQHLDRDLAAEVGVERAIDFPHPARAKEADDLNIRRFAYPRSAPRIAYSGFRPLG